jgi:hypothetical protein
MNTSGAPETQHGVAETEHPRIRFELCERMSDRVRTMAAIGNSSVERSVMAALRSYFGNPCNEGNTR